MFEEGAQGKKPATFPLLRESYNKSETGCVSAVFSTSLTVEGILDFLERSGDENNKLHHPVTGRGIVQGLVWFTLCNAAISQAVPNATMLRVTLTPSQPCIAKGSAHVPVTISVSVQPVGDGTLMGVCIVHAPRRRGTQLVEVFRAEGMINQLS